MATARESTDPLFVLPNILDILFLTINQNSACDLYYCQDDIWKLIIGKLKIKVKPTLQIIKMEISVCLPRAGKKSRAPLSWESCLEKHEALSSAIEASQHTVYPITQPVHGVSFSSNTDERVIKSPCCYADGESLFGFSFGQTIAENPGQTCVLC